MLMVHSYISDLQAKIAQLEQNPGNAPGASQERPSNDDVSAPEERESLDRDDQVPTANHSGLGTRENSPRARPDADEANLVNPLIESSKFMSSSSGRTCEPQSYCQ